MKGYKMDKKQVRSIIKLLKSKELETRPALRKIFENNGKFYASDGFIAFQICDVAEDMAGRCIDLDDLIKWHATAKNNDILPIIELSKVNEDRTPAMYQLVNSCEYVNPNRVRIDTKKLTLCCEFLNTSNIEILVNAKNNHLYEVAPIDLDIMKKAAGCRAYLMGLNN